MVVQPYGVFGSAKSTLPNFCHFFTWSKIISVSCTSVWRPVHSHSWYLPTSIYHCLVLSLCFCVILLYILSFCLPRRSRSIVYLLLTLIPFMYTSINLLPTSFVYFSICIHPGSSLSLNLARFSLFIYSEQRPRGDKSRVKVWK